MEKFDVIIIGSGLGGLICGNILSREGMKVGIFEKERQAGGNLRSFTRHGQKFETGVHYTGSLEPGQTLHRYWKYLGLTEALPLQKLDRDGFDRITFGDREFPLAQGFGNFTEQLLPFFPGAAAELQRYTGKIEEVVSAFPLYNLELPVNHREQHYTNKSALEFLQGFSQTRCDNRRQSVSPPNSHAATPLSAVLAGNNFLYGGHPQTPVHVSSLISHSFISGACRIIGGSDQVAISLEHKLISNGGTIRFNSEVIRIERQDGQFSVIPSAGDTCLASRIISDIHPAVALSLLPVGMVRPAYRKRIESLENTVSSFILHLTLKPGSFPYLNHNVYYHNSFNAWHEYNLTGQDWPGMYLLTTACQHAGQKFAETMTILTYMQYGEVAGWSESRTGNRGAAYEDFKSERAEKLLQGVFRKFPELQGAISRTDISTPLTYRDFTGIPEGSLYGIRKNYTEPMFTTVLPRTKIADFYFTGQNTNLHGLLGVTIGAVATCGEIVGLEYLLGKIKGD
ncbi:MAG: NAD(P)/FAD-dependent oxidoreductase [Bacteroidota bacterium]